MNKNTLTSAAAFMICLIVMFPVHSSLVMGSSGIKHIHTHGDDNVDGFMKTGDNYTVTAQVEVEGDDEIGPSQVEIGGTSFAECGSPDPDLGVICSYSFSTHGFGLNKPSQSYTISLSNDTGTLIDSKEAVITFDDLPPVFDSLDVPSLVGKSNFTFSYAVRDPTGSQSGCSGIWKINFYLNSAGAPFVTKLINNSGCSDSGEIAVHGSSLTDGGNTISAKVFDMVGHASSLQSETIEAEHSDVSAQSAEFLDDSGESIEWFPSKPFEASLVVRFSGPSIDQGTLKADLSSINPSLSSVSGGTCSESDGITTCRWDSVIIDISASKTAQLKFEMEDYAGNPVAQTMSVSMHVDTEGPIVASLSSAYAGTTNYIREDNNEFTARITENVALDPRKINLYIGDKSKGDQSYFVKADSCELIGGTQWQCDFAGIDFPSFSEGAVNLYILKDSTDKYGNAFTADYYVDAVKDFTPPILVDQEIRIIGGEEGAVDRGYIQVGDSLAVVIKLDEANEIGDIYADFSSIITGDDHAVPVCAQEEDGAWICVWETNSIDQGYADTHFSLHIEDMAGNAIAQDIIVPIVVLGVEKESTMAWSADVKFSSPHAIDRNIVTLYEPFIWMGVDLSSDDSSVVPVEISILECFDPEYAAAKAENESKEETEAVDSSAFLSGLPELYNYNTINTPTAPSYSAYTKFNLLRMAPEDDSLNITCAFDIKGIRGGRTVVYSSPVNVSFKINYFNNPIGGVSENVEKEIENVKDGWLVQAEWLGMLEKVLKMGQVICGLVNTYANIWNLVTIVKDTYGGTCSTGILSSTCALSRSTGEAAESYKEANVKMYETANKYCKMLNCQYARNDDINNKGAIMNAVNFITGNADFTRKMRVSGKDRNAWLGNLNPNIQSSLLLSMLYVCLPGVIYNLQKARAIDCMYINCLDKVEDGMPISMCTSQRGYAYCKFVFGEIFQIIPFASAISAIAQNIYQALSHPAEMVGFAMTLGCTYFCASPVGTFCAACSIADFFNLLADVGCDLGLFGDDDKCQPIWESFSVVGEDACAEALDKDEEEAGK